jgi:hypothetical protein
VAKSNLSSLQVGACSKTEAFRLQVYVFLSLAQSS